MDLLFLILLFQAVTTNYCLKRHELGGKWTVTNGTNSEFTGTVPGGIFSDLLATGKIQDIFFGTRDSTYKWISLTNWTYYTTFTVDSEFLNHRRINLVFEGLDTFATVIVNGKVLGNSDNMFVRYTFDVTELLKAGNNRIDVSFESAVTKAELLRQEQDKSYAVPPRCAYEQMHGLCNPNQIRKMQASFGWDWGPAFSSVGIWKPVYLEAFDTVSIEHVVATPIKVAKSWILKVTTYFSTASNVTNLEKLNVTLVANSGTLSSVLPVKLFHEDDETFSTISLNVPENSVSLWWPNGYGSQHLYNLTVTFTSGKDHDYRHKRIGFRTVELVQEPVARSRGLSFYFRVNGVGIFARGANQIPINVLPELGQNRTLVGNLLKAVKEANMNMLRVWGGGVYESDYFYDLTDEYGILIWQDFMFACSMYPTRPDYLKTVTKEVGNQVKRLSSHPSIAIWAGNNENEAALVQDWYNTTNDFQLYKNDYVKLYVDTIKKELQRINPYVIYATSSPSNGKASEADGFVSKSNPQSEFYGDVHYYNYGDDSWDSNIFPTPRFASEYGYQSMPAYDSWLNVIEDPKDLDPLGRFLEYRQHHLGGNRENLLLIERQLAMPRRANPNYVQTFIYYTQIVQAQSIKTETEHYRCFKGRVGGDGRGHTMGALYWQLNDVWVAPTWSSIDFHGKWKMLHYFARNFFANSIITAEIEDTKLRIYAVSDDHTNRNNVTVDLKVFKWNSFQPSIRSFSATFDPVKAVEVTSLDVYNVLRESGCADNLEAAKLNCFFVLQIPNLVPTNYIFPAKLKDVVALPNVDVHIVSVSAIDDKSGLVFEIKTSSNGIALFVWLDSHNIEGNFSDNGFLQITPEKTVLFTATKRTNVSELRKYLTITHLRDTRHID